MLPRPSFPTVGVFVETEPTAPITTESALLAVPVRPESAVDEDAVAAAVVSATPTSRPVKAKSEMVFWAVLAELKVKVITSVARIALVMSQDII